MAREEVGCAAITVDSDFPGGNIIVDSIEGDTIAVHQDLRDTEGDWFYWYFRVCGASGRELAVRFTQGNVIGVRGPAVSTDGGRRWRWLGAEAVDGQTFRYQVPADADEVRFSFGMPYLEANLHEFLARYADHPHLGVGELCKTKKGRSAELLRLGRLDGGCNHRVLLTCRHHCCEMMASYALEGIMETILDASKAGHWLRENAEFLVVPFVDKDGVENGDQGKNRRPRDHNRDYSDESVHATTRAIRQLVPEWSGGRLHFAMDMHCPHIRGPHNEVIYFVGGPNQELWRRVGRFAEILETVQTGPLLYEAKNNLPFGVAWNVPSNSTQGKSCTRWVAELPGIVVATSIEIPYANASGREVNAESARAFGHDLARAIQQFLQEAG